jgi:two-component system, OmpR family, sensor kinase
VEGQRAAARVEVQGSTEAQTAAPERARPLPSGPGPSRRPPEESETPRRWSGAAHSARARILASYVVLLALSAVVSILAIRQVLIVRLDDQVNDSLDQEMVELDNLRAGIDPETGQPFASLRRLFDIYFARNAPGDDEAMLAFVDGNLYQSSLAHFPLDRVPAEPLADWKTLSDRATREERSATGRFDSAVGEAHFRAQRIVFRDGATGAFVVTILPQAEREEIGDFQVYGAGATIGLLLIASAFAWLVAGRVLAPVQQLTDTARSISQSDLTRRIEVRGTGEAAEMARTFNAMLDRLENVVRSQREFVQDASHELRDPLTICRGHLELVGDDPDEQRTTVALVLDELERMGRIVDDLQVLADAEQPDFLRPEWIDLEIFGHELTAKASALAPRAWRLESASHGMLLADRHRITEAVMNLAHNAVQHTHPDDTIAIGTSVEEDEILIWVRDEGEGIAPADQSRIFDRFVRGDDAGTRYRGGGLGLAIVRTIAEAHGGRVVLESRPGAGSTFTIVIPRDWDGRDPRWHAS